jgi:hypothetical protein
LAALSKAVPMEVWRDVIATAIDQARDGGPFRGDSQRAGPCDASKPNGPQVQLEPVPTAIREPHAEPSPAEPPSDATSRPPGVAGLPVPAEWRGLVASWSLAWRQRWLSRSAALQAAGLPRDLAEARAYRAIVEEMAAT